MVTMSSDMSNEPLAPVEEALDAFWTRAITAARLNPAEAVMGQDDRLSLRPSAWAFGITREEADELCALVLSGKKTATSSYGPAYAPGEGRPEAGDFSILLDGSGMPRALLQNDRIAVTPFNQVGEDVARAEGEGDLSLEYWKAEHERVFAEDAKASGAEFDPSGDVITEFFTVLYQH